MKCHYLKIILYLTQGGCIIWRTKKMFYTFFKKYHTPLIKGPLIKDQYIHRRNPSWNLNWGFHVQGNIAPFSKRWCIFLKGHIQIVKTSSLQRMTWSLEQITAYINETEFEILVLEPVSRRLRAFYAILYLLKVFFKILLRSFQTEIAVLQRECT